MILGSWLLAVGLLLAGNATAATRVITLSPHLAELACAAGGCDRLVGVSAYSDYPPEVLQLPQVGDGFAVNLEAVLALRPDLVLAWNGGTPADTVTRLRRLGLQVESIDVGGLDEVGDALERVGHLLGTSAAADAAAVAYRLRLAALRTRWRSATPIRVVYQIETAPAYTVNGKSPISAALALCGGVNVFADLPTLAASVSPEAMLAAQPQAVLFGGEENQAAMHAYWTRLTAAPAQRLGTLYPVNADWLGRATPRLLDGVEQVCERLDLARQRVAAAPSP